MLGRSVQPSRGTVAVTYPAGSRDLGKVCKKTNTGYPTAAHQHVAPRMVPSSGPQDTQQPVSEAIQAALSAPRGGHGRVTCV